MNYINDVVHFYPNTYCTPNMGLPMVCITTVYRKRVGYSRNVTQAIEKGTFRKN